MPTSSKGMPERLVATPWTMDKRSDSAAPGVPTPVSAASLVGSLLRAPPPAHSGYGPLTGGHHVLFGSGQQQLPLLPDHPAAMLASLPRGMFGLAMATSTPHLGDPKLRLRPAGAVGHSPAASEPAAAHRGGSGAVPAVSRDAASVTRKARVVGSGTSSKLTVNGDSARDFLAGGSIQSSVRRDRQSDGGRSTSPSRAGAPAAAAAPAASKGSSIASDTVERQRAAIAALGLHTLASAAERRSTVSLSPRSVSPVHASAGDEPTIVHMRSSSISPAASTAAAAAGATEPLNIRSVAARPVPARAAATAAGRAASPTVGATMELAAADGRSSSSAGPARRLGGGAPPRTETPPGPPARVAHVATSASRPLQLPSLPARAEARVGVVITPSAPSAEAGDARLPPFGRAAPADVAPAGSAAGGQAAQLHLPVVRSARRPASAGPQATSPARHSVLPGGVAMLAVPAHVDMSGLRRPLSPLVTGGCIVAADGQVAGVLASAAAVPTVMGVMHGRFGRGDSTRASTSEQVANGCAAVPLDFSRAGVRPASVGATPSVVVSDVPSLSCHSSSAAASFLPTRCAPDVTLPVSAPASAVAVAGSTLRDSSVGGGSNARTPRPPLADQKMAAELAADAASKVAAATAIFSSCNAASLPPRLRADSMPSGGISREPKPAISRSSFATLDTFSSGPRPFLQFEQPAACAAAAAASGSLTSAPPRSQQELSPSRGAAATRPAAAAVGISLKPFNQRLRTVSNFPLTSSQLTSAHRQRVLAAHRSRAGCIVNPSKSLDLLRCNLQKLFNTEVEAIMKKRIAPFLQPAFDNMCANNSKRDGPDVVATLEQSMASVYCQLLEEAKKMFLPSLASRNRSITPDCSDAASDAGSAAAGRRTPRGLLVGHVKRHYSDTDSEASATVVMKKRRGRPPGSGSAAAAAARLLQRPLEPVKRDAAKWNPDRIKPEQLFIMGARANKALGLGATRGRLYIKHPEVFKYTGDQDDKQWLFESHLLPATGGKAYMLLVEDVRELAEKDEYKNCGSLMLHELRGFKIPDWMLSKVKAQMTALFSEGPRRRSAHAGSVQPAEAASLSSGGGAGDDNTSANAAGLDSSKATPTSLVESPYPVDELLADEDDADEKQDRVGSCVVPFLTCGELSGGSSSEAEGDDEAGGAEEQEYGGGPDDDDAPPPLSAPFTMTEPSHSIGEQQH